MILSSHGIIGSQITQFVGLLDAYPNAAAAYSLRKLRTAYTGSAIRVRRASDSTELDIGFSANQLDTSALTTFCSGTNGFVKTWYDQSGNSRNATQTTAANQPQIVISGNVITKNSKPYLSVNNQFFSTITTDWNSIYAVFSAQSGGLKSILGNIDGAGNNFFRYANYVGQVDKMVQNYKNNGSVTVNSNFAFESNVVKIYEIEDGGLRNFFNSYLNTQLNSTGGITTDVKNTKIDIFQGFADRNFDGWCSEIIMWANSQSSNRIGISNNINDFYSIY